MKKMPVTMANSRLLQPLPKSILKTQEAKVFVLEPLSLQEKKPEGGAPITRREEETESFNRK